MMPEILNDFTQAKVDATLALKDFQEGLEKYCWLQKHVRKVDVSQHEEFRRRFNHFYRVRRGDQWRESYFGLMEEAKRKGISFAVVLQRLKDATQRVEASFSSKLVATLDPKMPVIDRFVLQNMRLKRPGQSVKNREQGTVELYESLREKYREILAGPKGRMICDRFRACYPKACITEIKMVDLILWQSRGKD